MDKYGKKIGRKMLLNNIIDGIDGQSKRKMVTLLSGDNGRRVRKISLSLVKNGLKFIILRMIIGKGKVHNIQIILRTNKISLIR